MVIASNCVNIQAALLSSLRAGVNIILYLVVLPAITTFALSKTSSTSQDLWIARGSIVLSMLGTLILSVSATPILMVTGTYLIALLT
jgi:hypothetical protein